MATAVVSGRVDEAVKVRADAVIHAVGLSPAEVVKAVWEHIARVGEIPVVCDERAAANEAKQVALEGLARTRSVYGESPGLVSMTSEELKDMVAGRYA